MRKIDTLLNYNSQHHNTQLNVLTQQLQFYQLLQKLWQAASPEILQKLSTVGSLNNGQLTIYAHSAIVANKIKLSQASLLTQFQHLTQTNPAFRECKVTAISIKVQVKFQPKPIVQQPRKLSKHAATTLKKLANDLGDSPLSTYLNALSNKT